jgi:uncharacterized protein
MELAAIVRSSAGLTELLRGAQRTQLQARTWGVVQFDPGPDALLADVLSAQLKSNPANAPILEQAQTAIDALKSGNKFDTTGPHPGLMPLFRPQVQGFLIDAFSYDPAKLVGAYGGPVLILQGSRDIQVSVADAELLARAKPEAKLAIVPGANHVLKQVTSDDRSANLATYANPNMPLAAGIIDTLAVFVKSQK